MTHMNQPVAGQPPRTAAERTARHRIRRAWPAPRRACQGSLPAWLPSLASWLG